MAVTITKPEINVREKLKELDFETVPFQKMPSGSVLQVVQTASTTPLIVNSSSLLDVEPSITIKPKSSNNKVLVMHTAGGMGQDDFQSLKFALKRDGSEIWTANRYGFRDDSSSGGWVPIPFNASFLDFPNTTSSVTYNFAIQSQNVTQVRHNSDLAAFSGTSEAVTIAMEIAG